MEKAKIFSKADSTLSVKDFKDHQGVYSSFECVQTVEISNTRANSTPVAISFEDDDIIALRFEDGSEWIGYPDDVKDIYGEVATRSDGVFIFNAHLNDQNSTTRGGIKSALVKVLNIFRPKVIPVAAKYTAKRLAEGYDKKTVPVPGIYNVSDSFTIEPWDAPSEVSKKYLVLIHGTLSTTRDAFGELNANNNSTWDQIFSLYKNRTIALEHWTLSESPIANAIDFLKACPDEFEFDIVSHSRGGLIADIISKCDHRNKIRGFSQEELEMIETEDQVSYDLMLTLNKLIEDKKLTIGKVIRVAAPSSGTTILSRRVDHFFNLMLNGIGLAFGIKNPIYDVVKSFLLEVIAQKADPEAMPGLNSMMPESTFQKVFNYTENRVVGELYTISGDAEIGSLSLDSIYVILANLFYRVPNDLVVDTDRMLHGVPRVSGTRDYLSKDSDTNHFNYFSNKNTCDVILQALMATPEQPALDYNPILISEENRGVLLSPLSFKKVHYPIEDISGDRTIIILIPGIMGSTLSKGNKEQWVDFPSMNMGGIPTNLHIHSDNVVADGVIKNYYDDCVKHLKKEYDVITFPFDWRESLSIAATELQALLGNVLRNHAGNDVHIVAHSMGGLVVRQLMMDHGAFWKKFKATSNTKYIMLGTPWLGSYLIMEVLTGHGGKVKQLAAIDFKHNRKDLLEVFWKYPGVFELLPLNTNPARDFATVAFWSNIKKAANIKRMPSPSSKKTSLNNFKTYRNNVLKFINQIKTEDFKDVYYICGAADQTVNSYVLKKRHFSKHKKLVYWATSRGDGSVTWETGIPKALNTKNLYYSRTTHGELANEAYIFEGISDLLSKGTTDKLLTNEPISRGVEIKSEAYEYAVPPHDINKAMGVLFNAQKPVVTDVEEINVEIINGDLTVSNYPVMVGHFFNDLIFSAEKALDRALDERLSQRHAIGYYPGKIGESEVFFNLNTNPKGAIICGLGKTNELTIYLLSKTVEMATLKYAMFMRDNYTLSRAKKYANGISFILIGIGYGNLSINDSVKGILLGVSKANSYIKSKGEGLKLIKNIEFVNYYESIASQAYWSISRIGDSDKRIVIKLKKGITRKSGSKKKVAFINDGYSSWQRLDVSGILGNSEKELNTVVGFSYNSSNGYARVEREAVHVALKQVDTLLKQIIEIQRFDFKLSKTLFELLIPNNFKNIIRNQNNLVLKLDKDAAKIPWELFHDFTSDETPAAVSSGLIRQLLTDDSEQFTETAVSNINVLVIGDPDYDGSLPQLPAAEEEGKRVASVLRNQNYNTKALVTKNKPHEIMLDLFSEKYKILHFSGHGLYTPEEGKVGIVIGDGLYIDPPMLKQLGYVPEFVFINCCLSGKIGATDNPYRRDRYKFAANVGTQLIEMGVKAIVVAGWEVDDAAAKTFSDTFYDNMLEGYEFGRAVQLARQKCYDTHPNTNTWGAYQCYGNQFYKFNDRQKKEKHNYDYVIVSQIYTDLENLFSSIRYKKRDEKEIIKKLKDILKNADIANLTDATIIEKEALIYDEIGMSKIAVQKFEELFESIDGDFSMKALEQYCINKTYYEITKDSHDAILKRIENLLLIGKNPSRLNIVGNAFKHATVHVKGKKKQEYLISSYQKYKTSIENNQKRKGDYYDALSNIIYVGHLLEKEKESTLLACLHESGLMDAAENDIDAYLKDIYQNLDSSNKAEMKIYKFLGIIEICLCQMIVTDMDEKVLSTEIIDRYLELFRIFFSPRYIKMEIKEIEFFLSFVTSPKKRTHLEKITKVLEGLIS